MDVTRKLTFVNSMIGGQFPSAYKQIDLFPGYSSENINLTKVFNSSGLMQIHSNRFPSTQQVSFGLDVRKSTYIRIECKPSCNLLQINFQML
ncbi:hypothetical protein DPMN_137119 [Dreissena polymorpha]|uniref:Uncharacterized protein n=1 Tax=Dreissena polymorpha TaxID=45954 RepID=A0A9D4JDB8_DREPO|nr:hypothetical protein DPMN_137119 [Dreissena polymorpha]